MSNPRRNTRSSARWLIFTRLRTDETISVDRACQALVDRHVATGTLERLIARVPDGSLLRLRHVLRLGQAEINGFEGASWKRLRTAQQVALWLDANGPDITPSELLDIVAGRLPDRDADDLMTLWESHDRSLSPHRILQIAKATGSADVVRGVQAIAAISAHVRNGRRVDFNWVVSVTRSPPDVAGPNQATPIEATPEVTTEAREGIDVESAPEFHSDTADDASMPPVEDQPVAEPSPSGTESGADSGAGSAQGATDTTAADASEDAPKSEAPAPSEAGAPQSDRGDAVGREAIVRTVRDLLATFGTTHARVLLDADGVQVTVYLEAK